MSSTLDTLSQNLSGALGDALLASEIRLGELTVTVAPGRWLQVARTLRDDFGFEQLIDLCGVDYSTYPDWNGRRFCAVSHLLSVSRNQRLRVKVFADDDTVPLLDSVVSLWPVANWYEREAFDLYGIVFAGHPDLRRILTDYGFIGHPFRKDFPISGHVEMRYDPEQKRVVYQPLSIQPREVIPRVLRPEHYGDTEHHG
ncbi:MAG: NADH-quinone oxidoreductase subunit C [Betaproteobacteria bacterium]|nr:NADH-quinone oxidoreductase subunit C [Betaproteobacteria bacterium]MDE2132022.1 NADH-quinone oxidoreductase subunit C [Betaproteobacteria bacterium]